jgi:hypothetical protein
VAEGVCVVDRLMEAMRKMAESKLRHVACGAGRIRGVRPNQSPMSPRRRIFWWVLDSDNLK